MPHNLFINGQNVRLSTHFGMYNHTFCAIYYFPKSKQNNFKSSNGDLIFFSLSMLTYRFTSTLSLPL